MRHINQKMFIVNDIMGVVAEFLTPLEAFRCGMLIKGMTDYTPPARDQVDEMAAQCRVVAASTLDDMWLDLYNLDTDMTCTRLRAEGVRLPAAAVRRIVDSVMRTVDYLSRLVSPVVVLSDRDKMLIERIRDASWNPLVEPDTWDGLCGMVARMRRTSLYTKDVPKGGHRCQYILPDLDRQCMLHARPRRLFCGHHRWVGSHHSIFVVPAPHFRRTIL